MIGLEPTFEEHLDNLLQVFREVRRVLRKDGTCFLNYGDGYAGAGVRMAHHANAGISKTVSRNGASTKRIDPVGLKPKDLMMMPARVALALQADGWWIRSEIIWHKTSCMPESASDRPTSAHEKVYMLTPSSTYFYDAVAVRNQPKQWPPGMPGSRSNGSNSDRNDNDLALRVGDKQRGHARSHTGFNKTWDAMTKEEQQANGSNLRNVWSFASGGYPGAHFATFPPSLPERCIKAGTSEHGVCAECGAPWVRDLDKEFVPEPDISLEKGIRGSINQKSMGPDNGWDGFPRGSNIVTQKGWLPTCACGTEEVQPATVLDPFGGSGTVGLVADRMGRNAIIIEISPEYAEMARERIAGDSPMFTDVAVE